MRQLVTNSDHINNGFGAQNTGVMMGISGVQYSGSYGANLFGAISIHTLLIENDMSVALSVLNIPTH